MVDAKRPSVLILLSFYEGFEFIEDQLTSILGQEEVDVDVVIRAQSGFDELTQWIASESFSVIQVIDGAEDLVKSPGTNFHQLIISSLSMFESYDFVAFSDQDDSWLSRKLIEAVNCLDASRCDSYSSAVRVWNGFSDGPLLAVGGLRKYCYLTQAGGAGCTYVFRSQIASSYARFLIEHSGARSFKSHDWLFFAFCRKNQVPWFVDDRSFIRYRQHGRNVVGANVGLGALLVRVRRLFFGDYVNELKKNAFLILGLSGMHLITFLVKNTTKINRSSIIALIILISVISRGVLSWPEKRGT